LLVKSGLTKLESFARGQQSSLLRKFVNYGQKKFYNMAPGLTFVGKARSLPYGEKPRMGSFPNPKLGSNVIKKFDARNLRMEF
jgi:hypothetical protein